MTPNEENEIIVYIKEELEENDNSTTKVKEWKKLEKHPKFTDFGNKFLEGAFRWVFDYTTTQEEEVRLEVWTTGDGGKKWNIITIESKLDNTDQGTWIEVKTRLPFLYM
jgi:hypothetical protein